MERIQIGDEVLITGVQDKLEAAVGRTGIVISVLSEGDWILVKFPERFDPRLHGGGIVKDQRSRQMLLGIFAGKMSETQFRSNQHWRYQYSLVR